MLTREHNWELLLHNYIDSKRSVEFAWGVSDCALFVCDGIQAMTGTDVAGEFRGKYSDQAGAVATIKSVTGGSTVEDAAVYIAQQNAMKEWGGPLYAQRGDAVLFDTPDQGPALGLLYLDGKSALFVGRNGLQRMPAKKCRRAWRVGCPL